MKLIFIRHGDPNYAIDSLTEKGWKEAEYLSEKIAQMDVKEFFVSPLGRAKDTAAVTLNKMNRTAIQKEWLREFAIRMERPEIPGKLQPTWDWLPQDWMVEEKYFHYDTWYDTDIMKEHGVKEEYKWVCENFDALLAELGYHRDGKLYRVEKQNSDTYVFFCHFGLECLLLSHLLSVSPMILWHCTCAAPTSVTTVVTEERREGIASFRTLSFGDISHLYVKNEPPAFSARFCECFGNDEVHDYK